MLNAFLLIFIFIDKKQVEEKTKAYISHWSPLWSVPQIILAMSLLFCYLYQQGQKHFYNNTKVLHYLQVSLCWHLH